MSSLQQTKKVRQAPAIPSALQSLKNDEIADQVHMARAILVGQEQGKPISVSRAHLSLLLREMQEKQERLLFLMRQLEGAVHVPDENRQLLLRWAIDCAEDSAAFYGLCEAVGAGFDREGVVA